MMKRITLAALAVMLIAARANACDIPAAKMAADEAQTYARQAAYTNEAARETEDPDARADNIDDALSAARRAEAAADQVNFDLEGCDK